MLRFILNNDDIGTALPPGMLLLDFIRYHQHLPGTKIGCNEGDCGACTVLIGELQNGAMHYRSFTSCLTPLGNVRGKHVVTIEGINLPGSLTAVQYAMQECAATQCGFCTPGFVMSLTGFCLSHQAPTLTNAIAAIDGNICRCTGYKSIERAAARVAEILQPRNGTTPAQYAAGAQILPDYFVQIPARLRTLHSTLESADDVKAQPIGGGTDLYVQQHDALGKKALRFLYDQPALKGIRQEGNKCILGAATTVSDLLASPLLQAYFPYLNNYLKKVSSTQIRNMATIAGNFINASPIGDFSIFFLALDATLVLSDGRKERELPLRHLFKGYKQLNKSGDEYITRIWFNLPCQHTLFNFEKVSKRTHLDIASVNTAISITMQYDIIDDIRISAGGVGPVPQLLKETARFMTGKLLTESLIREASFLLQTEVTPISDARGTEDYKRLLLAQLFKAHFITLFPQLETAILIR
ncbi:FAD binding domain-containing protein [[Flexibacter] sp. ATCC 35208]|uniref:FAD binding domain-containing protein n=1 Tax=[Flexibacter] sp. ATCC 35208 TaxID=1936242 RepID=UPI0009CD2D4E|nr:FAD binding domain-containing protein [[Flexibacter] sp. ATCC 35208]OMP76593.1 (2Fe-2S)-binding protein [[Flexibacter] sp. ATCC 35208]